MPIIETGTGIVHVYVDKDADEDKARASSAIPKPVVLLSAVPWKSCWFMKTGSKLPFPVGESAGLQSVGSWTGTNSISFG